MRLLILAILLSSCVEYDFVIQPELRTYYEDFKVAAKVNGRIIENENLILRLKAKLSNEDKVWGLSYVKAFGQQYIDIDSSMFYSNDSTTRMVIYHELGHAKLNREHSTDFSLMNPLVTDKSKNIIQLDSLTRELFKN